MCNEMVSRSVSMLYFRRQVWECFVGCVIFLAASLAGNAQASTDAVDHLIERGVQQMRTGDISGAQVSFSEATHLHPPRAEAYLNLGLAEEQLHHYPEAVKALERAVALKSSLHGANLFLGIAEYQMNDLTKADAALRHAVQSDRKDAHSLMWLGVVELAEDHADAAAGTLDKAAALAPKDPDILYHRGRAHLLVSQQSYEAMFAIDPNSYRVHEILGQADAEADRTPEAIDEYQLAIAGAPHEAGLHERLGDLYWTNAKMDLAAMAYRQELTIAPYSTTTMYKLGSLYVIEGNPKEGLPLLLQTIKSDPSFGSAYYYLGRAQAETGDVTTGISNLEHAATASGDETLNTLAYYQLSRIYRRAHELDKATAAMAQFRRLRDAKDKEQQERRTQILDRRRQLPEPEAIPRDGDESVQPGR